MGDYTYGQVTIHECPPERVRALLDVLVGNWDLTTEYGSEDPAGALVIGEPYVANQIRCGSADEIAAELVKVAPEAFFETREDPRYEWLGDLHVHHPLLGDWGANCDSDGFPVFGTAQIVAAHDAGTLDDLLGKAWAAAHTELEAVPGQRVLYRFALDEDEQDVVDAAEAADEDEAHNRNAHPSLLKAS